MTKYYKAIVTGIVIIAILFLLLWWKGCNCGGGKTGSDTISVRIDTVYITSFDTIIIEKPVPYKVTYVKETVLHDTLETTEYILQNVDSARILAQYLATRYYDTTFSIQYGSARLKDTVTQNRIKGRAIMLSQSIPEVTKTITIQAPKRLTLYLSLSAMGNQSQLYGSGAGLDLMDKRGRMYGASYWFTKQNQNWIEAEIKVPIRLRKQ